MAEEPFLTIIEPFRIHSVEPMRLTTPAERAAALQAAGCNLFELRAQRLDRRRANYKDGHGLGLSIVRAIATAHDATITARPIADGGLAVSVSFPQPASPAASAEHRS
jgi:light-regulated signal transduction histidine kinase (bacteriophytochrome)